jgi:hypothetical protein
VDEEFILLKRFPPLSKGRCPEGGGVKYENMGA